MLSGLRAHNIHIERADRDAASNGRKAIHENEIDFGVGEKLESFSKVEGHTPAATCAKVLIPLRCHMSRIEFMWA